MFGAIKFAEGCKWIPSAMLGGLRRGALPLLARRTVSRVSSSAASIAASQPPPPWAVDEHKWTSTEIYEPTRLPIDEASTLPGEVYHNATFHKLEQARVFKSSWVAVAELADVKNPGDVAPAEVAGMPIVIANDKGTIRAFHNVCSHRGAKLVHEKCSKRKTLLCPYHRWGYALDGRLMGTPDFDDDETGKKVPEALREKFRTHHVKNFDKASMGLKPVRIDSALGLAFVNLDETAPPLNEWLGDLVPWLDDYMEATGLGKMHASHHITYDIKANWKLLIENFLEYYHLPAVHPALCDVSGVDEHQRFQGKGMYCGFVTHPLTKGGTAIDPGRLPPFPGLRPERHQTAFHLHIFPNVFFSLYPDTFFRVRLTPNAHSPHRTIEHATLLTHEACLVQEPTEEEPGGGQKILDEILAFWDNVSSAQERAQPHTRTALPLYACTLSQRGPAIFLLHCCCSAAALPPSLPR